MGNVKPLTQPSRPIIVRISSEKPSTLASGVVTRSSHEHFMRFTYASIGSFWGSLCLLSWNTSQSLGLGGITLSYMEHPMERDEERALGLELPNEPLASTKLASVLETLYDIDFLHARIQ